MPREDPRFKQFRATLCHNLAGLEHARGQHMRALLYARQGIRLRRKLPKRDRLPLVADQAALAAILVELGNLREAEAIHLRVLRVYRRRFGPRHYETASLLSNLGALYVKAGRFDAGERTLRRAARVLENVLGENHPRLATVLNNLATLCARRGKFSEADGLYARALRLLGRQLRPTYPSITLVRTNRSRTNTGYVLWVERSDRVRIHEMARDYDVDGTGPNQNCDICKETSTAPPAIGTPGVAAEIQARPDEPKHEHRERGERRERDPAAATRAAKRRAKRLCSQKS